MDRMLFTVEDTFLLKDRGMVLVPGIGPEDRIRVGDPLTLKRPDDTRLRTVISGIEMNTPNPRRTYPLLIRELSKEDVPIGTEVWSASPDRGERK